MQKGCPDIIPGLRAQPWWYIYSHLGEERNFLGFNILRIIMRKFEMKSSHFAIKKVFSHIVDHHGFLI
jgi:hypothetical protein